jgi:hypothetical protein
LHQVVRDGDRKKLCHAYENIICRALGSTGERMVECMA